MVTILIISIIRIVTIIIILQIKKNNNTITINIITPNEVLIDFGTLLEPLPAKSPEPPRAGVPRMPDASAPAGIQRWEGESIAQLRVRGFRV